MRQATIERKTAETDIKLVLALDSREPCSIDTGIGFFDHMLQLFAKHGFMDIKLKCTGDLHVDAHHTVEDCGIALGQAYKAALGEKAGIARYGFMLLPMDEVLVSVAVDISGRPYFVFNAKLPPAIIGGYDAQLTEEFFRAFAMNAGLTLHINLMYGNNLHHITEAIYKGVARALAQVAAIDPKVEGVPSTKGVL